MHQNSTKIKGQEDDMGNVMIVRHAPKGNGEDHATWELSLAGMQLSRVLGKTLPPSIGKIGQVGGSMISRSTMSALLIANGAGHDPVILASNPRLGTLKLFDKFDGFGVEAAMGAYNMSYSAAVRGVCDKALYEAVMADLLFAIMEATLLKDDTILGTHCPLLEIAYEGVTGHQLTHDAEMLDWFVVGNENGRLIMRETSLILP